MNRKKRILVTGAAGFIGHHLVVHLLENTDWDVVCLDGLNYATDTHGLLGAVGAHKGRLELYYHDLRSPVPEALERRIGRVDYIANVASGSHVERSIAEPVEFVRNNVDLVLNMLEYARRVKPEVFVQVSTDEVYGAAPAGHSHVEWEEHLPSNPYAASKSAQESIAISYWRTYGVPVVITNTMNNFGENQNDEKYIPMVVRNLVRGEPVTVHGAFEGGKFVSGSRVWLHAENHAHAISHIIRNVPVAHFGRGADRPVRLHVSGEREVSNLEIVGFAGQVLGIEPDVNPVDFHSSRPGHDLRYSLNGYALRGMHGWVPPRGFEDSFRATVLALAARYGWKRERAPLEAHPLRWR